MHHSLSTLIRPAETLNHLYQLEALLQQQAQALVARDIDEIVLLSGQCADLCRKLTSLLPPVTQMQGAQWSDVISQARACQLLHQYNSESLERLSACCQKLGNGLQEVLTYSDSSAMVYRVAVRSLFRL